MNTVRARGCSAALLAHDTPNPFRHAPLQREHARLLLSVPSPFRQVVLYCSHYPDLLPIAGLERTRAPASFVGTVSFRSRWPVLARVRGLLASAPHRRGTNSACPSTVTFRYRSRQPAWILAAIALPFSLIEPCGGSARTSPAPGSSRSAHLRLLRTAAFRSLVGSLLRSVAPPMLPLLPPARSAPGS